jgi:hypothetical protein
LVEARKAQPAKGKSKITQAAETSKAARRAAKAAKKAAKPKAKVKAKAKAKSPTPRKESKQALFIEAMRTAKGISITEAAERFGWQAHTVRGAVAGAIKKKLKLDVTAEKVQGRGTVYRIAA